MDDEGRSIAADTRETVAHRLGVTVPAHDLTATVGPSDPGLAETRDSLVPGRHDQPEQPALPDRLGRYVVLSQLGVGGMGVVYKAYDPELDRRVALKLLLGPASGMAAARLKREAQAMARLSHSNVVPIFDVGEVGGRLFVAMDLIDGTTLGEWMKLSHTWQEVLDLFLQAGRGLAAAHAVGLVHRDFKPEAVLRAWLPL